jgi:glycosyltransferase involved in cell wall biosynthesis
MSLLKQSILYVGNFAFPCENAPGKRVYANAKVLQKLGYDVIIIGLSEMSASFSQKHYDGFMFYNLPRPRKILDLFYYKVFFNLFKMILSQKEEIGLSLVIYYGSIGFSYFNSILLRLCRKHNVKVVSDCVDWLIVKTKNPLFNLIKFLDDFYQKGFVNKKVDGIIVISSYLANYYKRSVSPLIIIPPLSPAPSKLNSTLKISALCGNQKKIIYAGIPFRRGKRVLSKENMKDRIDKIIELLYKAHKRGCNFTFYIYGFSKEEFIYALPEQEKYVDALGESVEFHAFQKNEDVISKITEADFTILIRDVNRMTTAGFPTKVSESISNGTPVITTRTSDLPKYIVEGETGFFIKSEGEKAIEKLVNILNLERAEVLRMKENCIKHNPFYYENYSDTFRNFLDDLNV